MATILLFPQGAAINVQFGELYTRLCYSQSRLCEDGLDGGRRPSNSSAWLPLRSLLRESTASHVQRLRACVDADRLLEVPLEEPDEKKAADVRAFLGCEGGEGLRYPHSNPTPPPPSP